jgi:hypothetical protein
MYKITLSLLSVAKDSLGPWTQFALSRHLLIGSIVVGPVIPLVKCLFSVSAAKVTRFTYLVSSVVSFSWATCVVYAVLWARAPVMATSIVTFFAAFIFDGFEREYGSARKSVCAVTLYSLNVEQKKKINFIDEIRPQGLYLYGTI